MSDSDFGTVRVLVVEDNLDDQELLRLQLRKTPLGEYVRFLTDPREALQLLQGMATLREKLIALFVDVHLPYMSGIDLLRHVREIEGLQKLPAVMMTSHSTPEIEEEARSLRVAAFAEKPITLSNFSKVIADLFHPPQTH